MKLISTIDLAVGEVLAIKSPLVLVECDGEREWWHESNTIPVPDVTPQRAAEMLEFLERSCS